MTSRRGSDPHDFTGHIRIAPALNEVERAHVLKLAAPTGTLRGTPTGRGDGDVPFARMGWVACAGGCCLSWNPALEDSRMMLATLRFLIDHLLRPGAKAEGHTHFGGFTFDHVLDGAVLGRTALAQQARLVQVAANVVSEQLLPVGCVDTRVQPLTRSSGTTRRGRLPANVIEFRPRRA
jgi:hypothetical protein